MECLQFTACITICHLILQCFYSAINPTPISTVDAYNTNILCIAPDTLDDTCAKIPDGTNLIYKEMPNRDCNHKFMLFDYQSDGTMIHKCSNKRICSNAKGVLQISSQCGIEESKFERTEVRDFRVCFFCIIFQSCSLQIKLNKPSRSEDFIWTLL